MKLRSTSVEKGRPSGSVLLDVLDGVPVPISLRNAASQYIFINTAYCAAFGIPPGDRAAVSPEDVFPGPVGAALAALDRAVVESGRPVEQVVAIPMPGQGIAQCLIKKEPYRAPGDDAGDGAIEGVLTVALNVSGITEAERKMAQYEQRYRTIFEVNHLPMLVLAHDTGRVLDANAAARRLFSLGASPGGEPGDGSILNGPAGLLHASVLEHLADGTALEQPVRVGDAEVRDVEFYFEGIEYEGRSAILCTAQDLTEKHRTEGRHRALEQQLAQAQKMEALGFLAGGIAHDFNNFLTPIIMRAQLMDRHIRPDHPRRKDLQEILVAAQNARSMIEAILMFSRDEQVKHETILLPVVIENTLRMVRSSVPPNVRLEFRNRCGGLPHIQGHVAQLQQMLLNLINNALQAVGGREQGKVELRVEELSAADGLSLALEGPLAGWVRLVVEDDGCGMAADIMGRIFEPLFTTKEKRMGTGMGLAAVHSIVQRHHGRISVESQPGRGTTFAIYFPKVEVDLAEASRLGDRPFQAPDPGTRVLVVDDNVQVLSALQDVFTLHGLEADVLDSADEALSILLDKSRVYDLIIIDYMMPDRDGVDFIRELRRHGIDVPVILASGFPEEVMKKVGAYLNDCSNPKQLNMKAIIQKPFIYRKLLSTMAESLKPES